MTEAGTTAPGGGAANHRVMLAVITVIVITFCMAQTLLIPAIPTIERRFDVSASTAAWILTSFMLTSVVCTPLFGRLGDIYGKQRVMVILLWVFTIGCLICAVGNSIPALILGRTIQGASAAVFPLAYGIIRDEFPAKAVPGAIGTVSAMLGVGTGSGLVLAGPIISAWGISGIFWVLVVICVFGALAVQRLIPASRFRSPSRLDVPGGVLLSIALLALLLAISQGNAWGWESTKVLGLLGVFVVVTVIWVRWELRTEDPLVDISLMRERAVWTTNVTGITMGFVLTSSMFLVPQLVQTPSAIGYGFGATVTASGLYMVPRSIVTFFSGPVSGRLGSRRGFHLPLALGIAVAAVGNAWLGLWHGSEPVMYLQNGLLGIATGMAFAAMANLVVATVPREVTGVALGVNSVMRAIGGSLASQVAIVIITAHEGPEGYPAESGYTTAFLLTGAVALAGLAVVALIPKGTHRTGDQAPAAPPRAHGAPVAAAASS
jgi:MFS family permease